MEGVFVLTNFVTAWHSIEKFDDVLTHGLDHEKVFVFWSQKSIFLFWPESFAMFHRAVIHFFNSDFTLGSTWRLS